MEGGKGATLKSLVKVLRALGRADWLNTLSPAVSISPMHMVKTKEARQRVSPKRGRRRV